jgi:hypothetical protein
VEYAIEAIKLGSTAIGIQTDEGVILAVEKRITSPLMEPTSIEKVRQQAVIQIRIRIGSGFNQVSGSVSGLGIRIRIPEDRNNSHNRKKIKKSML